MPFVYILYHSAFSGKTTGQKKGIVKGKYYITRFLLVINELLIVDMWIPPPCNKISKSLDFTFAMEFTWIFSKKVMIASLITLQKPQLFGQMKMCTIFVETFTHKMHFKSPLKVHNFNLNK